MFALIVAMLAGAVLATPAHAQVQVNIGIHLPAPPPLVVIPEVKTVQYAPSVSTNLFFYDKQYWAFVDGGWHVSVRVDGPWIVVAPVYVPRPVLLVPVAYYRVPPGHWKQWQKKAPPRWGNEWGHEWAAKREWKDRDDDNDQGKGRGRDDDQGKKGKGEGPGKGQGHGRGKEK
jgi:hypothetical protein